MDSWLNWPMDDIFKTSIDMDGRLAEDIVKDSGSEILPKRTERRYQAAKGSEEG